MTSSLGPGLLSPPRTRVGLGCRLLQDRFVVGKHSEHPLNTSHAGVSRFCVATKSLGSCVTEVSPYPHHLGRNLGSTNKGAALTLYCESFSWCPGL